MDFEKRNKEVDVVERAAVIKAFVLLAISVTQIGIGLAQTEIDLRLQTRNVDFGDAPSTRPQKTGTTLPATCSAGDMFFKTDAAAGSNLFGCSSLNTWTLQAGGTINTGGSGDAAYYDGSGVVLSGAGGLIRNGVGKWTMYDPTTSTGTSYFRVRAGAADGAAGACVLTVQENDADPKACITADGYYTLFDTDGVTARARIDRGLFRVQSGYEFRWSSTGVFGGTPDTGLKRSAAGVLRVTNGSSGYARVDASGFRVSGVASPGNYLRGNGTDFVSASIQVGDLPDLSGTYQVVAEKGQANGYASLSASGLVPVSQLGSGTPDGTKFLRDDGIFSEFAEVDKRRICDIAVGDTTADSLTDAQLGPQKRLCFIPAASTVQEVVVSADGGTPSVVVGRNVTGTVTNLVSAALATAASGGVACANTGGTTGIDGVTTCSSILQNTALAAGSYIELVSGTAGGTAKLMTVHVVYTID